MNFEHLNCWANLLWPRTVVAVILIEQIIIVKNDYLRKIVVKTKSSSRRGFEVEKRPMNTFQESCIDCWFALRWYLNAHVISGITKVLSKYFLLLSKSLKNVTRFKARFKQTKVSNSIIFSSVFADRPGINFNRLRFFK